jgi:hypothetical protein
MVLPSQRKRRAARDAREAKGERLWLEEVPPAARVKIAGLWEAVQESSGDRQSFARGVGRILRMQGGHNVYSTDSHELIRASSSELALDIIGAFCLHVSSHVLARRYSDEAESMINETLEDFCVAYRLVDHEVVPIESDELHADVVVPALRLLVGEKFAKAHQAYVEAIKEIPASPSNAITDAGAALQETLTALGCQGNALGPLIADGRRRGVFAAHDATLTNGLVSILSWASADRSEKGDGHHVTDASRGDAWLMVHVVGALIVRLVDPEKRGSAAN